MSLPEDGDRSGRQLAMRAVHVLISLLPLSVAVSQPAPTLEDRIEGLLVGSLIGDAAGGPHEFQTPLRSRWTAGDRLLSAAGIRELAASFRIDSYEIEAAPYAHWVDYAPAGTITDDSRFKILFFESLESSGTVSRQGFAHAILRAHADTTGQYGSLPREWLNEFSRAARWVLGQSEDDGALPPERAWGGIPTMAGQMPFPPVAALHPGDPEDAYRRVWEINFLDNGIAVDLNAALIAGLAAALAEGASWESVEAALRSTDPFEFGRVPWVPRRLDVWLDFAHDAVQRSDGRPSRLFAILENELDAVTWWEAWVPMTVVFACAKIAEYDPLATMQLILEFGHDTDSYLQVAGALIGALYGVAVFPEEMRDLVELRLEKDYGARVERWIDLLGHARKARIMPAR